MASIKEVAKHAGVAISTVSKVLNGYPNVSKDTREKVMQSINKLNYIPNSIASALSSKQSGRVALIMDPMRQTQAIDQIFMQYLMGALEKARERSIEIVTIFFSMITEMTKEEIVQYLKSQGIAGVIIYGMSKEDIILQNLIKDQFFACVVVDAPHVNEKTTSVSIDHKRAQSEVARKTILDDNCKRVLYIAGKKDGYVTEARLDGIKELAQELHLVLMVRYGDFSERKARELAFRYAKGKDVVVCASDLMAIGAMNALTEMDIFRPVCGFDGIALMGYVGKQMNTINQDFYSISSRAVEEIDDLLKGGKGRKVILKHSIVKMYYQDIIC